MPTIARITTHIVLAAVLPWGGWLFAVGSEEAETATSRLGAAAPIVSSLEDPDLRLLVADVLARNPGLARLEAEARATDQRAPQVRALPDPRASLTLYLLEPQTRVGPQQVSAGLSQTLPWFGKLKLKERAALLEAASAWTRVDAARIELVTETRSLYHQLQFLDREQQIVLEDRSTLEHYEELAQARYASGVGLGQAVIKIQAEITGATARLLDIDERRATLIADINALRDRPEGMPVPVGRWLPETGELPSFDSLRETALGLRPELAGIQARIDSAGAMIDLAGKQSRPDFNVGVNYAWVGRRDDPAGQADPPEDNGRDIFGVTGGVTLPIWRSKIRAGVDEAVQQRLAAEQSRRAIIARIERDLADIVRRIPLIEEQLALFDGILTVQAEESLRSAEAAYASGTAGALDLLDAERVLLRIRIAAERARTDVAVATAALEGVLAAPLQAVDGDGS